MMQRMRCDVEVRERLTIVRLAGELDHATVGDFAAATEQLLAGGFGHLVLDLRELSFMDSTGLGQIIKLHIDMPQAGRLQIIDGPYRVQNMFTVTGLRRVLPFATAEQALGPA